MQAETEALVVDAQSIREAEALMMSGSSKVEALLTMIEANQVELAVLSDEGSTRVLHGKCIANALK